MMIRCLSLVLILLAAGVCPAGMISVDAQITAPADRLAIDLFIHQAVPEDGSAESALDAMWDRARQWLINNGFTPKQIWLGPAAVRLFQDEKQYLVRRVILIMPVDPARVEELPEKLARLVDQAMARGLEPASKLDLQTIDQQRRIHHPGWLSGQFIYFLPQDPAALVEQAIKKGMDQLNRQLGWYAGSSQIPDLHLADLEVREPPLLESDPEQGQIGIDGPTVDGVLAQVKLTARLASDPQAPAGRTLEVTGQGHVQAEIEQAILLTRLASVNPSFQGAMDDLAEQTRRLEKTVSSFAQVQLEMNPAILFSGYISGINFRGRGDDGQIPEGAYRNAGIHLHRQPSESEADFRIRVDNLAGAVRGGRIERPYEPPAVLVLWGSADEGPWRQKAMEAAVADARQRAGRHAATLGLTIGRIVDVGPAPEQGQSPMAMLFNQFLMSDPDSLLRQDAGVMVRFDERPMLDVRISVRFSVQQSESRP